MCRVTVGHIAGLQAPLFPVYDSVFLPVLEPLLFGFFFFFVMLTFGSSC